MKKSRHLADILDLEAKGHGIRVQRLTTLLFEWPIKTSPRLALPLFIFLAVLLHLSTIYFFNIVYEPPHVSKPVAAQVFFLLPNSPSAQQLTPWLQANDPAVFSPLKTVQASRPKIPTSIYQLSQPPPVLRSLPPPQEDKMAPLLPPTHEIAPPPSSSLNHLSIEQPVASPAINRTTTVRLLETLATRTPSPPSTLGYPSLPSEITTPLHPTIVTVNIDAMGIPHHAIITQSSGNEAADEAATHWLMTRHFAPATEEMWGKVLIFWGSE